MTARKLTLVKALLNYLSDRDGAQVGETILHAEVNLRVAPTASLAEFNDALKHADDAGWLTGIPARYGTGKIWKLSEAGEAARMEMQ